MKSLKVLYVAYRHDPQSPDSSSGADYQFYQALVNQNAVVSIIGPYDSSPYWIEQVIRRINQRISIKRYAKFPLTIAWQVSQDLNKTVRELTPDVIFTIFPPALTFYNGKVPCIYRQDTSFLGWQAGYHEFSKLGYYLSMWSERRVFSHCSRIITHSKWNQNILAREYGLDPNKITVIPNPAALPKSLIPSSLPPKLNKKLTRPLHLLFVGRDPVRKGVDIAIDVVRILNEQGLSTLLTISGLPARENVPYVKYAGSFKKSIPEEVKGYVELLQEAHFLLHPARFDPSPIVTAEAAAFGIPTITNDVGGVATSVADGISGIVLPGHSPAELYAQKIIELVNNPQRYYSLCETTRKRYEKELNWDVAGKRLMEIVQQVVEEHRLRV